MDKNSLYARGYTITQAAKTLHVSVNHVACVLRGERKSDSLMRRLTALPQRSLRLREVVSK